MIAAVNPQIDLSKLLAPFPASDIEWRIARSGAKDGKVWATCFAYVTNRAIMQRLDEVCGPENWRNEFAAAPNSSDQHRGVMCGISIRINGEWITKFDGADSTDIEQIKGGFSDAMKRAGVQWGIGRYLYDLEENFAEIPDNKTKGARYAKTKEGAQFFWLPPALPAWALPKGEKPKAATTAPVKPAPKTTGKSRDYITELTNTLHKKCHCLNEEDANAIIYHFTEHEYNGLAQARATADDAQVVLKCIDDSAAVTPYENMLDSARMAIDAAATF